MIDLPFLFPHIVQHIPTPVPAYSNATPLNLSHPLWCDTSYPYSLHRWKHIPYPSAGAFKCYITQADTVKYSELGSSQAILRSNYGIDSLMLRYDGVDWTHFAKPGKLHPSLFIPCLSPITPSLSHHSSHLDFSPFVSRHSAYHIFSYHHRSTFHHCFNSLYISPTLTHLRYIPIDMCTNTL